ncbi:MAG: hypothetical protein IKM79_03315 [Bacteroidales bacterium]|nr:hypothetical protein [Bacteroidales bacterium]
MDISIFGSKDVKERVKELQYVCSSYAENQQRLKTLAESLYNDRKTYVVLLTSIPDKLSAIDKLPSWCNHDMTESLQQLNDFQLAIEYEESPQKFAEITDDTGRTAKIIGSTAATGTAIATLGPTTAMSIATAIGTASTGTAISALSGAAATNAALAWLGGGAVAAGGAGVAGGSLLLGMFGPIGLAIASMGTIGGIVAARIKNKKKVKEVENLIDTIKNDNGNLRIKLQHLSELINRSEYNYSNRLKYSIKWLSNVHPKDYKQWDDDQKHELERLINVVSYTVQLINERV